MTQRKKSRFGGWVLLAISSAFTISFDWILSPMLAQIVSYETFGEILKLATPFSAILCLFGYTLIAIQEEKQAKIPAIALAILNLAAAINSLVYHSLSFYFVISAAMIVMLFWLVFAVTKQLHVGVRVVGLIACGFSAISTVADAIYDILIDRSMLESGTYTGTTALVLLFQRIPFAISAIAMLVACITIAIAKFEQSKAQKGEIVHV